MGTTARIFLNGEEQGIGNGTPTAGGGAYDSRAFAWIATGDDKGSIYELPSMGNTSFENLVANPWTGDKTAVMIDNDTSPAGQVFMYLGDKTNTGNDVQKAGLVGGTLYGVVAAGIGAASNTSTTSGREASELNNAPTSGSFTLAEMVDAVHKTGTELQSMANDAGVSGFWRPEDGAWDPTHHNVYYFNTTSSNTGTTRVWSLTFSDLNHLESGGTFKMVYQGTPGVQEMFDNMTISDNGHIMLNEDPGNYKGPSKLWDLDPATGQIHQVGALDPALFGNGNGETNGGNGTIVTANPQAGFSLDKETSGILDVTNLLGNGSNHVYLTDVQNHFVTGNPLTVEGGQLNILTVANVAAATRNADLINGTYNAEAINGKAGNDTINGGSGADTLDGAVGADVLNGDAGDDMLNGGAGDDNLAGGVGADTLCGGVGNDLLAGGEGNDSLTGAAGDDVLVGGLGADTLAGGAGNDTFRYASAAEGGDLVVGFRSGQDHFEFSAAGFGGGLVAGAEISLLLGKVATATTGQFVYDASHGNLLWDVDGNGAGAAVVIAHFAANPHLTAEDFTIIA
jgi:Ca2+-binding RTX toxin-like protein